MCKVMCVKSTVCVWFPLFLQPVSLAPLFSILISGNNKIKPFLYLCMN